VDVARQRRLRNFDSAPPQLAPQLVLIGDRRRRHQISYRIVTFVFHWTVRTTPFIGRECRGKVHV
jgi:hypothetical protein